MLSKEKIFSLFENTDEKSVNVYEDFMDNPYAKIGMFNKIIQNNGIFLQNLKHSLNKIKREFDEKNLEIYSQFVVFNRAFFYINQIDVENILHIDALKCYNQDMLSINLDLAILYFETNEEYEKCACLFKIKILIKNF